MAAACSRAAEGGSVDPKTLTVWEFTATGLVQLVKAAGDVTLLNCRSHVPVSSSVR